MTKFPNTKYARDSKLKIHFLRNTLAKNELNIGKFYLRKGAPASSVKRFKFIFVHNNNNNFVIYW